MASQENDRAQMDRIRAFRGLPPLRDTRQLMFEQVAAARCYIDRASGTTNPAAQRRDEMHAFMSIFHPEVPAEKVRQMASQVSA